MLTGKGIWSLTGREGLDLGLSRRCSAVEYLLVPTCASLGKDLVQWQVLPLPTYCVVTLNRAETWGTCSASPAIRTPLHPYTLTLSLMPAKLGAGSWMPAIPVNSCLLHVVWKLMFCWLWESHVNILVLTGRFSAVSCHFPGPSSSSSHMPSSSMELYPRKDVCMYVRMQS